MVRYALLRRPFKPDACIPCRAILHRHAIDGLFPRLMLVLAGCLCYKCMATEKGALSMHPRYLPVALCLTAIFTPGASADTISYTGGAYAQSFAYSQDFNSLPATGGTVVSDPA